MPHDPRDDEFQEGLPKTTPKAIKPALPQPERRAGRPRLLDKISIRSFRPSAELQQQIDTSLGALPEKTNGTATSNVADNGTEAKGGGQQQL